MSALIDVKIQCDRCDTVGPVVRKAAWLVRAVLARAGWHRYNGVDVCDTCWAKGIRGPSTYYPRPYYSARRVA